MGDNRIQITGSIFIDPTEIDLSFIKSSGPGGQNVNKVATAVQLRFDLMGSPSLPRPLRQRAARLAGNRLTNEGVLVLTASGTRSQTLNREDAISRLVALLKEAAVPPKPRIKTRPTLASKTRRLDAKSRRGATKAQRRIKPQLD